MIQTREMRYRAEQEEYHFMPRVLFDIAGNSIRIADLHRKISHIQNSAFPFHVRADRHVLSGGNRSIDQNSHTSLRHLKAFEVCIKVICRAPRDKFQQRLSEAFGNRIVQLFRIARTRISGGSEDPER